MIYIYCPYKSSGALELVKAFEATRLRRFDGEHFWSRGKKLILEPNSSIIAWGAGIPQLEGFKQLNAVPFLNKFEQGKVLNKYVSSVPVYEIGSVPLSTAGRSKRYVFRSLRHQGGLDILGKTGTDYLSNRYYFTEEYRIHCFLDRSIRAGVKVIRDGFTLVSEEEWRPNANMAHPWVRSYEGGWRVNYDNFSSTAALRHLAKSAVKALNLSFGAVDIGKVDKSLLVLEVNSAPGIEGGTVNAYVRAIKRWINGDQNDL